MLNFLCNASLFVKHEASIVLIAWHGIKTEVPHEKLKIISKVLSKAAILKAFLSSFIIIWEQLNRSFYGSCSVEIFSKVFLKVLLKTIMKALCHTCTEESHVSG